MHTPVPQSVEDFRSETLNSLSLVVGINELILTDLPQAQVLMFIVSLKIWEGMR